jgi:hypothetical protein
MYLVPMCLIFLQVPQTTGYLRRIAHLSFLAVTAVAVCYLGFNSYPITATKSHTGQYKEFQFHSETAALAQRISNVVGDRRVLIAGDDGDLYVGNMQLDGLLLRYYLLQNSIGGLYRIDKKIFGSVIRSEAPDFVLVTHFNDKLRRLFKYEGPDSTMLFKVNSRRPLSTHPVAF